MFALTLLLTIANAAKLQGPPAEHAVVHCVSLLTVPKGVRNLSRNELLVVLGKITELAGRPLHEASARGNSEWERSRSLDRSDAQAFPYPVSAGPVDTRRPKGRFAYPKTFAMLLGRTKTIRSILDPNSASLLSAYVVHGSENIEAHLNDLARARAALERATIEREEKSALAWIHGKIRWRDRARLIGHSAAQVVLGYGLFEYAGPYLAYLDPSAPYLAAVPVAGWASYSVGSYLWSRRDSPQYWEQVSRAAKLAWQVGPYADSVPSFEDAVKTLVRSSGQGKNKLIFDGTSTRLTTAFYQELLKSRHGQKVPTDAIRRERLRLRNPETPTPDPIPAAFTDRFLFWDSEAAQPALLTVEYLGMGDRTFGLNVR